MFVCLRRSQFIPIFFFELSFNGRIVENVLSVIQEEHISIIGKGVYLVTPHAVKISVDGIDIVPVNRILFNVIV